MDGLFSPVETWMSRRDGLTEGASFTACPQGDPSGVCSFGYFSCTNKKSDSPVATLISNGVSALKRAKKPTNRSSAVALFRPSPRYDFAQNMIDTGE